MDEIGVSHKREVYAALNALGDIGGFIEITMIIFGIFLLPISRHSFYLRASRSMFFARSRDESLFIKGSEQELEPEKLAKYVSKTDKTNSESKSIQQEMRKHHIIRITKCNNIKLYFARIIPESCWSKK